MQVNVPEAEFGLSDAMPFQVGGSEPIVCEGLRCLYKEARLTLQCNAQRVCERFETRMWVKKLTKHGTPMLN
jgi:hypothetical protein